MPKTVNPQPRNTELRLSRFTSISGTLTQFDSTDNHNIPEGEVWIADANLFYIVVPEDMFHESFGAFLSANDMEAQPLALTNMRAGMNNDGTKFYIYYNEDN